MLYKLIVDPKKVEFWELIEFGAENPKIINFALIFARYIADDNDKLLSPVLPNNPIDELSKDEIKAIKDSDAYKAIKRFSVIELMATAKSFLQQATGTVSPK